MRSLARSLRALMLGSMLIGILSGCTTMTGSGAIEPAGHDVGVVACDALQPITWSGSDTDPTIRQIKAHNAVYTALCPEKK